MSTIKSLISHLYKDNTNGQWVIQTNDEHQRGVAELAATFAKRFGMYSWGYALGMLHDKGKECKAFQQYIRKINEIPFSDTQHYADHQHAFVGGLWARDLLGKSVADLLINQIISHHTGLHDYVDVENVLQKRNWPEEIRKDEQVINREQMLAELRKLPFYQQKAELKHFHHLSRMLFSCLVDADWLDTERFMNVDAWQKRGSSSTLADLLPMLEAYLQKLQVGAADTEVNRIRNMVQNRCRSAATGDKGFYSLTVPTGGGKTLSSLLWAMKHAVHHGMSRIIIAIPYTSIIVQTAGLLKQIFGEEHVLEHHSQFDPDDIKVEEVREKAKLATENWDYPIVVTTNVQLFESMFSNRPSHCRKLHNIVNAVILLDEVQTLPTGFLMPIVDALKAYQQIFGVSVLLTTASQPVLSGQIMGANPREHFEGIDHITEIIPEDFALHDKLRRVEMTIDPVGKTYDELAAQVASYDKVLCIVNTRRDAKEIYDRLPAEGRKLHLSRMMCPAHISETICEIKKRIKDPSQSVVRVVATQLVEAGVDMDFPVVFRQEAGLDSLLQAAGRCNREGKQALGHTFVFSLAAEGRTPFGAIGKAHSARLSLPPDSDWFAPSVMKAYFLQLYARANFDVKDIRSYLYKCDELCFASASDAFKLIDDDSVNVIVNWHGSMDFVGKLKKWGCTYALMKQLAKFTVGIPRSSFKELVKMGAIEEVLEGIYVLPDSAQYDGATGLRLDNHWMNELLMA